MTFGPEPRTEAEANLLADICNKLCGDDDDNKSQRDFLFKQEFTKRGAFLEAQYPAYVEDMKRGYPRNTLNSVLKGPEPNPIVGSRKMQEEFDSSFTAPSSQQAGDGMAASFDRETQKQVAGIAAKGLGVLSAGALAAKSGVVGDVVRTFGGAATKVLPWALGRDQTIAG